MQCSYEHAKKKNKDILFIFLYVDDFIFIDISPQIFEKLKQTMIQDFDMMDIRLMSCFLYLEVKQSIGSIFIS